MSWIVFGCRRRPHNLSHPASVLPCLLQARQSSDAPHPRPAAKDPLGKNGGTKWPLSTADSSDAGAAALPVSGDSQVGSTSRHPGGERLSERASLAVRCGAVDVDKKTSKCAADRASEASSVVDDQPPAAGARSGRSFLKEEQCRKFPDRFQASQKRSDVSRSVDNGTVRRALHSVSTRQCEKPHAYGENTGVTSSTTTATPRSSNSKASGRAGDGSNPDKSNTSRGSRYASSSSSRFRGAATSAPSIIHRRCRRSQERAIPKKEPPLKRRQVSAPENASVVSGDCNISQLEPSGHATVSWRKEWWDQVGWVQVSARQLGHGTFGRVFMARMLPKDNFLEAFPQHDTSGSTPGDSADVNPTSSWLKIGPSHPCHCKTCGEIPLAIKEFRGQAVSPFQFLREEAMIRHCNAHVIRPVATRSYTLPDGKTRKFQLMMLRAQGDLAQRLKKLIERRARLHLLKAFEKDCQVPPGSSSMRPRRNTESEAADQRDSRGLLNIQPPPDGSASSEDGSLCDQSDRLDFTTSGMCGKGRPMESTAAEQSFSRPQRRNCNHARPHDLRAEDDGRPPTQRGIFFPPPGLREREAKFLFGQLLSGVAFLHNCIDAEISRVVDIKPSNILVFCSREDLHNPMKWHLCLADFGSCIMHHPTDHFQTLVPWAGGQREKLESWKQQVEKQLQTYQQGTIYNNAPEALRFDRNGNLRSNNVEHHVQLFRSRLPETTPVEDGSTPGEPERHPCDAARGASCPAGGVDVRGADTEGHDDKANSWKPGGSDEWSDRCSKEKSWASGTRRCSKNSDRPPFHADAFGDSKPTSKLRRVTPARQSRTFRVSGDEAEYAVVDERADAWSLGITLGELSKGGAPGLSDASRSEDRAASPASREEEVASPRKPSSRDGKCSPEGGTSQAWSRVVKWAREKPECWRYWERSLEISRSIGTGLFRPTPEKEAKMEARRSLLAQRFHGRRYSELDDEGQRQIDKTTWNWVTATMTAESCDCRYAQTA